MTPLRNCFNTPKPRMYMRGFREVLKQFLMHAAQNDSKPDVIAALLKAGADLNAKPNDGKTDAFEFSTLIHR